MYLALYRKYRPKTFADVISQPHITQTLQNQIKSGQIAHAYLFTGSRGTGKTTCAKILAKAINCTESEDGNPCLKCESCKLIDEGTSDILEIDAASNNGVDDIRALRDEIMFAPVSCKYRVYIIDEVHMLSINAFNALLKTIEEPPPHVIFILATTESHKVPATILSRCQRFEFRRIDIRDSAKRLLEIAEKENTKLSDDAAMLISRLSDGGMRDALSLLDQCISVTDNVTANTVRECAGVMGDEPLFAIADAVCNENAAKALEVLDDLHKRSKDTGLLIQELILHYRNLMLLKSVPENDSLVSLLPDELEKYNIQNKKYSLAQILRCLEVLHECLECVNAAKQRKILVEMTLIRLCTPKLDNDISALSGRIDKLECRLNDGNFTVKQIAEKPSEASEVNAKKKITVEKAVTLPEPLPEKKELPDYEAAEENTNVNSYFSPDEPQTYDDMADFIPPPEEIPNDEHLSTEIPPKNNLPSPPAEIVSQKAEIKSQQNSKPAYTENYSKPQPFRQWTEVMDMLPASLGGILDGSTAEIQDGEILVSGSPTVESIIKKPDNSAKIVEAVYNVTGQRFIVKTGNGVALKAAKEEENKVDKFLESAKELGIKITIN